jgi:hypothetical protein
MTNKIDLMLRSHPRNDGRHNKEYIDAVMALGACAETCTICADACLAEPVAVESLRHCITANLDCADVCEATSRLVLRRTESPNDLVHAQLHACVLACQLCADECAAHADMHEHCRVCAQVCRSCQERCNYLLGEITSSGVAEEESF